LMWYCSQACNDAGEHVKPTPCPHCHCMQQHNLLLAIGYLTNIAVMSKEDFAREQANLALEAIRGKL
jgi:hypothetical protein